MYDDTPSNILSLEAARQKRNTQGKSSSWVQSIPKSKDTKIAAAISQAERIVKLEKIVERQMTQIGDLFRKYQESRALLFQTLKELQDWKLDRR